MRIRIHGRRALLTWVLPILVLLTTIGPAYGHATALAMARQQAPHSALSHTGNVRPHVRSAAMAADATPAPTDCGLVVDCRLATAGVIIGYDGSGGTANYNAHVGPYWRPCYQSDHGTLRSSVSSPVFTLGWYDAICGRLNTSFTIPAGSTIHISVLASDGGCNPWPGCSDPATTLHLGLTAYSGSDFQGPSCRVAAGQSWFSCTTGFFDSDGDNPGELMLTEHNDEGQRAINLTNPRVWITDPYGRILYPSPSTREIGCGCNESENNISAISRSHTGGPPRISEKR